MTPSRPLHFRSAVPWFSMPIPIRALALTVLCLVAASPAPAQIYTETFDGTDASPWPAPWFAVTSHVLSQDLQGNRARWNGEAQFVARMTLPGFAETDVEVECTVEFEDVAHQGFGFYVRQNGGYMQDTVPFGQGYAMFLKGNWAWAEDLGLWTETNGVEQQFQFGLDPVPGGLQDGVPYRVRYRVTQETPTQTRLRAKVWEAADVEPSGWTIEGLNGEPVLQGTPGTFAVDVYNHSGTAHLFLDDLVIHRVGTPTAAMPAASTPEVALRVRPNPFRGSCRIEWSGPAVAGRGYASIYDVRGRLRARLAPDGTHAWTWRGTDDAGRALPAGTYFLRADGPTPTAARLVKIR